MRITLASASPRRRALLATLGYELEVVAPAADETPHPGERVPALVARLAVEKARSVEVAGPRALIVAADTSLEVDGEVLGKPRDDADATAMLTRLAGRAHAVHSGWCVRAAAREWGGVETSTVHLLPLGARAIRAYVATGEPRDKAGAYGVQGRGAALVARIEGSVTNVVGLPLEAVLPVLDRALGSG